MSRREFAVFVRDFPVNTTDAELGKFFAPLKVIRSNVARDQVTKASRGFGFVHFATEDDMKQALTMKPTASNGQKVTVQTRTAPAGASAAAPAPRHEKPSKAAAADGDDWHLPAVVIAVYFGTFDPVHENHIALANHAVYHHRATEVVFVPNPDNVFKPFVTSLKDRIAMLEARLAVENAKPRGKIMSVYHSKANQSMNWQGRADVCAQLRAEWKPKSSSIKMYQIMGQDSFEEATAQKALSMKHVREHLDRTLLIFPRDGCPANVRVSGALHPYVQIAEYEDDSAFSSTTARSELYDGKRPELLHDSVFDLIKERGLYKRLKVSPTNTIVVLIGGPGCGKGTLARFLAEKLGFVHFSAGDFYRASAATPAFSQLSDRLRHTSPELWGQYLTGTTELCLQQVIATVKATRFVIDGYDETNIMRLENTFGGVSADYIVNMQCPATTLLERLVGRGRETSDEAHRRIDKFTHSEEAHAKQLKSFLGSGRDVVVKNINVEDPVEEYVENYQLLEALNKIIATKTVTEDAASTFPENLAEQIVAAVCAGDEFKALHTRLSEECDKITPAQQAAEAEAAAHAASAAHDDHVEEASSATSAAAE